MLKQLFVICLKFRFNWEPCILSVRPIHIPFMVPYYSWEKAQVLWKGLLGPL